MTGIRDPRQSRFDERILLAGHCDGCIGFHAKALARMGIPREQIIEVLAVAVYMGGGPSLMYAADAMQACNEFQAEAVRRAATSAI